MLQHLIPTLGRADGRQRDLHVELAPPFLLDGEGRLAEGLLLPLAEGLVQLVDAFLVAGCGQLFAFGGEQVDGDFPFAHGEAFDFLGFVAVERRVKLVG